MGGGKMNQFSRTQLLLGTKGMQSLHILDGNQNDVTLPFVFANVRGYYMDRYTRIVHELLSQKE